jgi:uncharacterized membrane protein
MYSTRDQTVRFAYVTSLWVNGKQTHILHKKTKDIIDIATETASYKVGLLPLGTMFIVRTVHASLPATPKCLSALDPYF